MSEDGITGSDADTQPATEQQANPKYNLGGTLHAWWNEGEEAPRHLFADARPLAEVAHKEQWTEREFWQRVQGFTDGLELMMKNYNIFPRDVPLSEEEYFDLQQQFQAAYRRRMQEAKQQQQPTTPEQTTP